MANVNETYDFWLYCKNARITSDVHIAQLLAEVAEIQWDIICFSETRAADGEYTLNGGHGLFCGRGDSIYAGVAILVNTKWVPYIICSERVSDRIVYIDLDIFGKQCRVIAVYFPHAGYPSDDFHQCLYLLRTTIMATSENGMKCMVGGDFNLVLHHGWRGTSLKSYFVKRS